MACVKFVPKIDDLLNLFHEYLHFIIISEIFFGMKKLDKLLKALNQEQRGVLGVKLILLCRLMNNICSIGLIPLNITSVALIVFLISQSLSNFLRTSSYRFGRLFNLFASKPFKIKSKYLIGKILVVRLNFFVVSSRSSFSRKRNFV